MLITEDFSHHILTQVELGMEPDVQGKMTYLVPATLNHARAKGPLGNGFCIEKKPKILRRPD